MDANPETRALAEAYFNETDPAKERELLEEMGGYALETMENARPEEALYFKRLDRDTIVQTQEEYEECVSQGVRLDIVSHGQAVRTVAKTRKRVADKRRNRAKAKVARASRKRNR